MVKQLLKKGSPILREKCTQVITQFPLSDDINDTIDACKDELRSLKGFWKSKGMSIAASQVG
jgi:peptide deformylase